MIIKEIDYKGSGLDLAYLFEDEPFMFFLDSSQFESRRGRFSFIGFDPVDIVCLEGADTIAQLRRIYREYEITSSTAMTPLPAGLVGVFNYDCNFPTKKIKKNSLNDLNLPDCFFGVYDVIITIDHLKEKCIISSTGISKNYKKEDQLRAESRINYVLSRLKNVKNQPEYAQQRTFDPGSKPELKGNFTRENYLKAVESALEYIANGDIYQVNLSQRFECEIPKDISSLQIYSSLRAMSPSCFGGYFRGGDFEIISSSPEQFLRVTGKEITTRPMKGTRPRGLNNHEDKKLNREITESAKDKAELLMVTDLERNDLGKVCRYGSIKVEELRTIEKYSTVFQATSSVKGILVDEKDVFDVIEAAFPGGSITGCPKLRAMEIIEELEPTRRGFYTGSLGFISFTGDMELNILIRTLLKKNEQIFYQVGGGIVADSDPQNEYEETLIKAKAINDCLGSITQKPILV